MKQIAMYSKGLGQANKDTQFFPMAPQYAQQQMSKQRTSRWWELTQRTARYPTRLKILTATQRS